MILFVSGATGGHLYPAVAMAQYLNLPCTFVVSREQPAGAILKPYGFLCRVCKVTQWHMLLFPWALWCAWREIRFVKPRVLISMGGGICVPFVIVAWILRIPVVAMEQNVIPGRATRMVQFFSRRVVTAFDSTVNALVCRSKVLCFGNPVRVHYPQSEGVPTILNNLSGKVCVVIGGSQGALGINQFITEHVSDFLSKGWHVVHLTGPQFFKAHYDSNLEHGVQCVSGKYYVPLSYVVCMDALYKLADFVICRAGATTIAELQRYQCPALLVPFPYAKDNHQLLNAQAVVQNYSTITLIEESDLTIEGVFQAMVGVSKLETLVLDGDAATESVCGLIKSYLE
jgi:UDP-N-acetylglucosamine--N-acetylmuramyl-(pentapeptide) pyrophosphoryl-undecaprenol N-acetylglucosamine transferase